MIGKFIGRFTAVPTQMIEMFANKGMQPRRPHLETIWSDKPLEFTAWCSAPQMCAVELSSKALVRWQTFILSMGQHRVKVLGLRGVIPPISCRTTCML
jgi:hypothetical protein